MYDSTEDTLEHIRKVQARLQECISNLTVRAAEHDRSKLHEPEKEAFDRMGERLKTIKYGSPEYAAALEELGPALRHHYELYGHHPQHFENGMDGMSLLDLMEWLADITAASERTKQGSVMQSMEINRVRFAIGNQLYGILLNTVKELGW